MSKPHNYQQNRDDSNNKVEWYLGLEEWRENEIVVTAYAEGSGMHKYGDGYTHEANPSSALVEDSFQFEDVD